MAGEQRTTYHIVAAAAAGVVLLFVLDGLGFFEGLNRFAYDLAFRLRGEVRPHAPIVLVTVDEESLGKLGPWPLKRSVYGALLDKAGAARAVGFAIIMSEPREGDDSFAAAIARHGRVVVPAYIDDRLRLALPAPSLGRVPTGHLHLEPDVDGIVRHVYHGLETGGRQVPSLALALRDAARAVTAPSAAGAPLPEASSAAIAQHYPMYIDFCGPPGMFPRFSLADVVAGNVRPDAFRDAFVLVGVTAPGIDERVIVPFSQARNRMAPVEVQANILDTVLKGNGIRSPSSASRLALCAVLAGCWLLLFLLFSEAGSLAVLFVSLAGIPLCTLSLFAFRQVWVDPAIFALTVAYLYTVVFVYRLAEASARLGRQYEAIAADLPAEGSIPPCSRGIAGLLSIGGINASVAILDAATQQLVERSIRIESANRELEAFNYSVSHDLQAPLRVIRGFAAALEEDCREEVDPACREYLARIRINVTKMEELIEALLGLSRIGRADLLRLPVDLSDMATEIAGELRRAAPERPVEFVIRTGVVVNADAHLMRAVMTNLMENAWKFTAGVVPSVIEFGVEEAGGERRLYLRDNGVGFDNAYADKLFVPFQRLHSKAEFPGTGIGLATVQRIIHRHGGRVWARGETGSGAVFFFTVPA